MLKMDNGGGNHIGSLYTTKFYKHKEFLGSLVGHKSKQSAIIVQTIKTKKAKVI